MLSKVRKKLPAVVAGLSIFSFAVVNVLLIRQNLQLRTALNRAQPESPRPGDRLPPFSAKGLAGELLYISYDGRGPKRVFLFFTPPCRFCREQFPYWREMMEKSDKGRFDITGLVADSEDPARLAEYLRAMAGDAGASLRVAMISDSVRHSYKLSATPITLVVANDGTVEEAWAGRWGASDLARAGSIFGFDFSQPSLGGE